MVPSPGADVGREEPRSVADMAQGEPGPRADVEGVSPVPANQGTYGAVGYCESRSASSPAFPSFGPTTVLTGFDTSLYLVRTVGEPIPGTDVGGVSPVSRSRCCPRDAGERTLTETWPSPTARTAGSQ